MQNNNKNIISTNMELNGWTELTEKITRSHSKSKTLPFTTYARVSKPKNISDVNALYTSDPTNTRTLSNGAYTPHINGSYTPQECHELISKKISTPQSIGAWLGEDEKSCLNPMVEPFWKFGQKQMLNSAHAFDQKLGHRFAMGYSGSDRSVTTTICPNSSDSNLDSELECYDFGSSCLNTSYSYWDDLIENNSCVSTDDLGTVYVGNFSRFTNNVVIPVGKGVDLYYRCDDIKDINFKCFFNTLCLFEEISSSGECMYYYVRPKFFVKSMDYWGTCEYFRECNVEYVDYYEHTDSYNNAMLSDNWISADNIDFTKGFFVMGDSLCCCPSFFDVTSSNSYRSIHVEFEKCYVDNDVSYDIADDHDRFFCDLNGLDTGECVYEDYCEGKSYISSKGLFFRNQDDVYGYADIGCGDFNSTKMLVKTNSDVLNISYKSMYKDMLNTESFRPCDCLGWCFSVLVNDYLLEIAILKDNEEEMISLSDAIGIVLDCIGLSSRYSLNTRRLNKYQYCKEFKNNEAVIVETNSCEDAKKNGVYVFDKKNNRFINKKSIKGDYDLYQELIVTEYFDNDKIIHINLISNDVKIDLCGFKDRKNIITNKAIFKNADAGVFGCKECDAQLIRSFEKMNNPTNYCVKISYINTQMHTPQDYWNVQKLGGSLGISEGCCTKKNVPESLETDVNLLLNHYSWHCTVLLTYMTAFYGVNKALKNSINSKTSELVKNKLKTILKSDSNEQFLKAYCGASYTNGELEYSENGKSLRRRKTTFINSDAENVMRMFAKSYRGGYNICTKVGYYPYETFDYDIISAYPSAMCLIPDVDWECPIKKEIIDTDLTLEDWKTEDGQFNPYTPFVGEIKFEFDENVKCPCLGIKQEDSVIYVKRHGFPIEKKTKGAVFAGPLIYLALRLGAKIHCIRGYFLNVAVDSNGCTKYSLREVFKDMISDRAEAKQKYPQNKVIQAFMKQMVNGVYGKISQGVSDDAASSPYEQKDAKIKQDLKNAYFASMTTSITTAILIAANNQLEEKGFEVYSATTDGFISNCDKETLDSLDLYGFSSPMHACKIEVTGNDALWEEKHRQKDLLNYSTMGNVSLSLEGVCAHKNFSSGFEKKSFEDRMKVFKHVLERNGKVEYESKRTTSLADLKYGQLKTINETKKCNFNYDFKRKPKGSTLKDVNVKIHNNSYTIANFETEPYNTIEEYKKYKNMCSNYSGALKTKKDYCNFFYKLNHPNTKSEYNDVLFLKSCVFYHHNKEINIPMLNNLKNTQMKVDWLNQYNDSAQKMTVNDYQNACRKNRKNNLLSIEEISEKLEELINDSRNKKNKTKHYDDLGRVV